MLFCLFLFFFHNKHRKLGNRMGNFGPTSLFSFEMKPLPAFLKIKTMCFLNVFSIIFMYTLLSSRQKRQLWRWIYTRDYDCCIYCGWSAPEVLCIPCHICNLHFPLFHHFMDRPIIKWFLNAKKKKKNW